MKQYEILLAIVVIMVLSVGTVSAWDWDNIKTYDSKEREVTIVNAFGLGEDLLKAKLITEDIVYVMPGKDRQVAEFQITTLSRDYGYENAFQDMAFYDIYSGKEINREFKYKLRETIGQTPIFETTCEVTAQKHVNGSSIRLCTNEIVDYFEHYSWSEIKSFDEIPLVSTTTIGIFIDVRSTDYVEWIPNFYGRDVGEWASWTTGLTNNLTSYWKFNNTLSNGGCCNFTVDSIGNFNMTLNTSVQQTGLFGNASEANEDGSGSPGINLRNYGAGWTIVWWMNITNTADYGSGNNYMVLNANDGRSAFLQNGEFNLQSFNAQNEIYIEYDIGGQSAFARHSINNVTWQMITLRGNSSTLDLFINLTKEETKTFVGGITYSVSPLRIYGDGTNAGNNMKGMLIDEMGFWNRTLTDLEVRHLYNNGTGMTYFIPSTFANIVTPTNITYNSTLLDLNYTTDGNSRCLYSKDNYATNYTTVAAGVNWTSVNATVGTNLWSIYCNSTTGTSGKDEVRFHVRASEFNTQLDYPPNAYKTFRSNMNFTANFSAFGNLQLQNATLFIWYQHNGTFFGTNYTTITEDSHKTLTTERGNLGVTNYTWTYDVCASNSSTTLCERPANRSFELGGGFGVCNATLTTPFLNFTYAYENTTRTNASIDAATLYFWVDGTPASSNTTYTYSSATEQPSQAICYSPTSSTLRIEISQFNYKSATSPLRRYRLAETTYTSAMTTRTLYLVPTADGSYATFQTQTSAGVNIEGVKVKAERLIGGSYVLIEEGFTDGAGAVTFWLDPDYDYRITATKVGYSSVIKTIRPTSATYTIIMDTSTSDIEQTTSLQGLLWTYSPKNGILSPGSHRFFFNITANLSNMNQCKIEIYNLSAILASNTGCTGGGGNISVTLDTTNHSRLWGRYSVNLSGTYYILDSDAGWRSNMSDYSYDGGVWNAINRLRGLDEFGEDDYRKEFSSITFVFFIIMIALAAFSYATGWDAASMGGSILIVVFVIWILSFPGFLTLSNTSPFAFLDKYFVALVFTLFAGGYAINSVRRDSLQ